MIATGSPDESGKRGGVASHLEKKKGDFTPLFKKLEARIKEMGTLDNKERNAALHSLREDLEAYINAYEPAPAAAFAMLHRIYARAQDQEDFWPPFGPENDQAIQDFLVQLEKTLDARNTDIMNTLNPGAAGQLLRSVGSLFPWEIGVLCGHKADTKRGGVF